MKNISHTELSNRIQKGENINLLDVREPDEHAAFNIGGTNLPLGHVMGMQTDDIADWQEEEVVVYCQGGRRSMQAGLMLETLGFKNIINLDGGMNAWQETLK